MTRENKAEEANMNIDRRTMVKGLASLGAVSLLAGGLAACSPNNASDSASSNTSSADGVTWDGEYDFVVVGAGGAGLGAALTAVERGATVLTLEIEPSTDLSNTALCGGVMMACDTPVQRENGLEGDNAENFKKYIDAVSGDLAYIDLLHQWADRTTENFDWVVSKGVEFPAEYLYYSGQEQTYTDAADPYPRGHIAEGHIGSSITKKLYEATEAAGGEFIFKTQVTSLYQDADGRVIGVKADSGSYKANNAVILCSGGFSRNKDMLKNFIPDMIHGGSFGSSHQQGDGIRMGIEVGAKIGNMWAVQAKCTGTYLTDTVCPCNTVYSWGNPCVMVDETGRRVIAEDTFYEKHYAFIASQPHAYTYIVFDQNVIDLGSEVISVPPMSEGLTSETNQGLVYKADTIAELATQLQVEPSVLEATMTRYNEMMATGVDEDFGRLSGLGAVNTPPFYACKLIPAICDTAGGLVVNNGYQVLDNYDEPIPGLYAAGANSAGWRGTYYVGSGTAVSYAIISGRIAIENALGI